MKTFSPLLSSAVAALTLATLPAALAQEEGERDRPRVEPSEEFRRDQAEAREREEREQEERRDREREEGERDTPREADQEGEAREQFQALRRHASQLQAEIRELEEAGRRDEAARLRSELANVRRDMVRLNQTRRGPELQRRIEARRQEIAELILQGRHEEAERLTQALEQRLAALRDGAPESGWTSYNPIARFEDRPPPEDRRGPGPEGDLPARLEHVRAAIEHLHQAGMHDMAMELERRAQEMGMERREGGRRDPFQPGPRPGSRPPMMEGDIPPAMREMRESMQQTLQEMRAQMEEMRRAMEEMRQQMRREMERR